MLLNNLQSLRVNVQALFSQMGGEVRKLLHTAVYS